MNEIINFCFAWMRNKKYAVSNIQKSSSSLKMHIRLSKYDKAMKREKQNKKNKGGMGLVICPFGIGVRRSYLRILRNT